MTELAQPLPCNPKFGDIIETLPGVTKGTIKMSGFSFQKPGWTTEELDG